MIRRLARQDARIDAASRPRDPFFNTACQDPVDRSDSRPYAKPIPIGERLFKYRKPSPGTGIFPGNAEKPPESSLVHLVESPVDPVLDDLDILGRKIFHRLRDGSGMVGNPLKGKHAVPFVGDEFQREAHIP